MSEVWMPLTPFPGYAVSNFGRVKNTRTVRGKPGGILRPWLTEGYPMVGLRVEGQTVKVHIHRLVALEFLGLKGEKIVDHKDRDRTNNHVSNLRVTSQKMNCANSRARLGATSAYKGVCKCRNGWAAYGKIDGKTVFLGRFSDEVKAAKAYDRHARKTYKEFALLNFPAPPDQEV